MLLLWRKCFAPKVFRETNGGSKPPPYDKCAWQAEHPAVHRVQLTGQVAQTHKYTKTGSSK